jgi:hypothetical protein
MSAIAETYEKRGSDDAVTRLEASVPHSCCRPMQLGPTLVHTLEHAAATPPHSRDQGSLPHFAHSFIENPTIGTHIPQVHNAPYCFRCTSEVEERVEPRPICQF